MSSLGVCPFACRVTNCVWEELNVARKQHKSLCPFTSITKDQTAKARSFGIQCVSLLDINFDGFSSAKLYQQRITATPQGGILITP